MKTEIAIDGTRFYINEKPTYEGVEWQGRPIEGLLFNSRMIQAIFDDSCPETASRWAYPDTGVWDPERNTNEFCAALPEYRRHGLLGVTVGLQGGGSVYTQPLYDTFENSAFDRDGSLKPAYLERLVRVLKAADDCGMIVIVNYFYFKHLRRFKSEALIKSMAEAATDWLLRTGFRNILVDVFNEANRKRPDRLTNSEGVHELIEIVQQTTLGGRRLPAGSSSGGGQSRAEGRWLEIEDFCMPHGNGLTPDGLRAKLRDLKSDPLFARKPRPILVNEDSIFTENMDAAIEEYASWGFYCQGYGSVYKDRMDWTVRERESRYEELSGFQTMPVNWSINTEIKKAFFSHVLEVTQGK
ncbi:MAG: hypothetical protein BWZ10_02194 [candidate division BRC1 bacterium ADurb.BinA364]|nr:MAG: hypothetical protein BWZ10_02194 [candidate division BRC1 bacterium ADurb.BinA364]